MWVPVRRNERKQEMAYKSDNTYYVWRRHESRVDRAHLDGCVRCTTYIPEDRPSVGEHSQLLLSTDEWASARKLLMDLKKENDC